MGLINARNLRKAKQLLDKNRHKVGGIVEKAGEKLDKASGGKTSNVTAKAADAAKKYSESGVTHTHVGTTNAAPPSGAAAHSGAPVDPAAANAASIAATNAVTAAATAAANLMNNAAVQAQIAQAQAGNLSPEELQARIAEAQRAAGVDPASTEKVQATHKPIDGGPDHGADWSDQP